MAFADEKAKSRMSDSECSFYLEGVQESASFRKAYKTEMKNVVVEDQETINLQKNEIDSLDELSDMDSESEDVVEENTPIDYTKLTMSVLKEVADKKGLTGYKSLKKAALINLIENN